MKSIAERIVTNEVGLYLAALAAVIKAFGKAAVLFKRGGLRGQLPVQEMTAQIEQRERRVGCKFG